MNDPKKDQPVLLSRMDAAKLDQQLRDIHSTLDPYLEHGGEGYAAEIMLMKEGLFLAPSFDYETTDAFLSMSWPRFWENMIEGDNPGNNEVDKPSMRRLRDAIDKIINDDTPYHRAAELMAEAATPSWSIETEVPYQVRDSAGFKPEQPAPIAPL